jgi:hypothetical protein
VTQALKARNHDPHPDLLAAVVLHALVAVAPIPLTLAQLATACERDPASPLDCTAIEGAVESLIADGLAQRRGSRCCPTRAALRADALRF